MKISFHNTILSMSFISLLIAGCGFHLRKAQTWPLQNNNIAFDIEENNSNQRLRRLFEQRLRQTGIHVNENAQNADIIQIRNYQLNRRTIASGSDGQEREYTLSSSMDVTVLAANQDIIFPTTTFSHQRDLRYSEARLLGRNEGERLVEQEMQQAMIDNFFRQLSAYTQTPKAP